MKAKILILLVLIIAVLVSSGCTTLNEEGVKVKASTYCPDFKGLQMKFNNVIDLNDIQNYDIKSDNYQIKIDCSNNLGYYIVCGKGSETGDNVNYFYCKDIDITQKLIDKSGNIIDTSTKTITIVFDENKNYLETRC